MAGAELMDEAFLDSTSSHSGVLEAAEPTEEWLSTGSDLLTTTDGDLSNGSAGLEPAESAAAAELDTPASLPPHEEQPIGSMEELGFLEANAPLQTLPELPLEEDAAVCSEAMDAVVASREQLQWPCSTPNPKSQDRPDLGRGAEDRLPSSSLQDIPSFERLPSFAPRLRGRPLETPFAESCAESPFEAPSPRDMQLSPAEEQLVPASGLSKDIEPNVEQASGHPRSPVLADRSKTEQLLWKPVQPHPPHLFMQRSSKLSAAVSPPCLACSALLWQSCLMATKGVPSVRTRISCHTLEILRAIRQVIDKNGSLTECPSGRCMQCSASLQ